MKLIPKEGVTLRDPVSKRVMPKEGFEVDDHDTFWLRRLRDGDVIRADQTGGEQT